MSDAIRLSDRLEAIIRLCPKCETLADIGCDHGYISISAVERHIAERAIACDINEGPLKKAGEHIAAFGLRDRIETRLADGLAALTPNEANVIVIAGMGGHLMGRIIEDGIDVALSADLLVLGPQSEVGEFRKLLVDRGFIISDEDMIEEDGKYYPLIAVKPEASGTPPIYSDRELRYGPVLIAKKHPTLFKYLMNLRSVLSRNLESIERAGSSTDRADDIRTKSQMIDDLIKEMS